MIFFGGMCGVVCEIWGKNDERVRFVFKRKESAKKVKDRERGKKKRKGGLLGSFFLS